MWFIIHQNSVFITGIKLTFVHQNEFNSAKDISIAVPIIYIAVVQQLNQKSVLLQT
jgi:hypothetical protein